MMNKGKIMDKFTGAFFEALLWSSSEDTDGQYFAEETCLGLIDDCRKFQEDNAEILEGLDAGQCGRDFALTRNYHGTGFWDRGWGEVGKALTKAAHKYNEVHLYVGDDGLIYG